MFALQLNLKKIWMFYVFCPLLSSTVDCQSINLPLLRSAPPITQRRNQRKDVLCSFLGPKISSLLCLKICSRLRWDTSTWLNSAVHTESSESFFFSNVKLNQQVFQHLAKLDFFVVSHRLCLFCIVFGAGATDLCDEWDGTASEQTSQRPWASGDDGDEDWHNQDQSEQDDGDDGGMEQESPYFLTHGWNTASLKIG